jgi:calcineurin-like phosphoesterase
MTRALVDLLLQAGTDVITSGNHGWDGPEAEAVHGHPRVLRPLNMPPKTIGRGLTTVEVAGEPVTIVNLASERGMIETALPVYPTWQTVERRGAVIVDFHGDATWEKMIFATAIDGEAAAVLGTHTHEATEALHILPGGTGFVADVGMTGPTGHPGGFPLTHFAAKYRGNDTRTLPPFTLATGPLTLGAVLLRIEDSTTRSITRIR